MNRLLQLLCLLGVADGVFLILAPEVWSKFWMPKLKKIGRSRSCSLSFGVFELAASLWLLRTLTPDRLRRDKCANKKA